MYKYIFSVRFAVRHFFFENDPARVRRRRDPGFGENQGLFWMVQDYAPTTRVPHVRS